MGGDDCSRRRSLAAGLLVGLASLTGCTSDGDDSKPGPEAGPSGTTPPTSAPPSPTRPTELPDVECQGKKVTIVGTQDADRIVGTRHRDVIWTMGGDDLVIDVDDDLVCTGAGNDRVRSTEWLARVDLGAGDDRFTGVADLVRGGAGDDLLRFGHAVMKVKPGAGNDLVVTTPARHLYNASCVTYAGATRPIVANLTRGRVTGQGRDLLRGVQCVEGSRFADTLIGSPGNDALASCDLDAGYFADRVRNTIRARAGNDQVTMCPGGGLVHLGDGRDTGIGGLGDDWMYGDAGPDQVWGFEGSDHLVGGDGNDRVNGTFYCDTASSAGTGMGDDSPNQVWGGNGDDEVTGDLAADLIDGGPGFDHGYGGPTGRAGDDLIVSVERLTHCP